MSYQYQDYAGRDWTVPDFYVVGNPGPCKGCGQVMLWTTTPAGKRAPLNADGSSHFATCLKADQFRKRKP
jgi:hypothetical protein